MLIEQPPCGSAGSYLAAVADVGEGGSAVRQAIEVVFAEQDVLQ